ncbi:formimidoylglutamate deiminase [Streptomyces alkaliphilus]|uniref:Formimidoylglutamate deiminase n=1 Tax=Streptomyces alkaliphilus TaxID=1472722 RepID=A0A7W3TG04_9ACTN|nr:formimidoylglutamate deiminase [Streptomyces alkaliphilus]MBB0246092.1 formimidoylglutamate deiminase [Streptomyces alkaliphilus]
MSLSPQTYWAERARVGDRLRPGVLIASGPDGRITDLRTELPGPPPGAVALRGLTLPGMANAHSHAFHRALRGRGQGGPGGRGGPDNPAAGPDADTFWTWREGMYRIADRLTPDAYRELAVGVYAEMALAGITCVGEFHYLHHAPGGVRYNEPNIMAIALGEAAAEAGIRLVLLDTCYLTAGFGRPPEGPQLRFADTDADAWAERVSALRPGPGPAGRIGAAAHSVRAVPAEQLGPVARWARDHDAPLHVHLSEQPAENEECLAATGRTPTRLLADHGVLGPRTTAVHATHPTAGDIDLLGGSGTGVCLCPTTERDLADGIGPAAELAAAGCPLSLGSDSHAVIDLFEEARAVEMHERLRTGVRGRFTADELLTAACAGGWAALGMPEGGRIAVGAPADLITIDPESPRTAGVPAGEGAEPVVFAAGAADVLHTVVAGRHVVRDGIHQRVPGVAHRLAGAVTALAD